MPLNAKRINGQSATKIRKFNNMDYAHRLNDRLLSENI